MKLKFCERINEIFEEYKDKDHHTRRKEFADICGITKGQLDGWLSGRGKPDIQILLQVSNRLKIPVSFLIGESDVRTTEKVDFYQRLPPEALDELNYYFDYLSHKYNIER